MIDDNTVSRAEITARLAESRRRLRHLLTPEDEDAANGEQREHSEFPRSHTMRVLSNNRALTIVATIAGAVLIARPQMLLRLARMIPVATIGRLLVTRYLTRALTQRGA